MRLVVGRPSIGPQLILTLISYTPLRYVRNVARSTCEDENESVAYVGENVDGRVIILSTSKQRSVPIRVSYRVRQIY